MTPLQADISVLLALWLGIMNGLPIGYRIGLIAKKVFLDLPKIPITMEQFLIMHQDSENLLKIRLAVKEQVDKLHPC